MQNNYYSHFGLGDDDDTLKTQEPIIDEDTWLRVHELRQNKRRPTKTGRKSLFSGLVYCPDCGAKLHFCASNSLRRDQEFFRCSNYKSGRGKCTIHFIRDVALEELVLKAITDLASFVSQYEPVFLYLLEQRNTVTRRKELQEMETKLEFARRRVKELDRLIAKIYEDNALGKLSNDRYSKMFANYETEQKGLEQEIIELEDKLKEANQAAVDVKMLLRGLREFMEVRQLTPTIVNTLIRRIEVHNNEKKHSHGNVKVDIYFTAAGMLDLPTENEMVKLMDGIRQHQGQKLSA